MKEVIRWGTVFLAMDNLSESSIDEAKKYVKVGYCPGSILMVTAWALEDLKYVGIDDCNCLAMPELKEEEARALFFFHAEPKEEVDKEVVMRCISRCRLFKGYINNSHYHPLALKVLGSQLAAQDPEEWESQLNEADVFSPRQKRENPGFSILRRSFDRLMDEDRLLFMDVALFNVGGVRRSSRGLMGQLMGQFYGMSMNILDWLSIVHGSSVEAVKRRVSLFGAFVDSIQSMVIIYQICRATTNFVIRSFLEDQFCFIECALH